MDDSLNSSLQLRNISLYDIPLCVKGNYETYDSSVLLYTAVVFDIGAILLNCFHTIILSMMELPKGKKIVMYNTTTAVALLAICILTRRLLLVQDFLPGILVLIHEELSIYLYRVISYSLMLALAERLVATHEKDFYGSSKFIKHIKIWIVLVWLIWFVIGIVSLFFSVSKICLLPGYGITSYASTAVFATYLTVIIISSLFQGCLLCLIFRRLKYLLIEGFSQAEDFKNATYYYVAVLMMTFACLLIPRIFLALGRSGSKFITFHHGLSILALQTLFTFAHPLCYFCFNQNHRAKVRSLWTIFRKRNRIDVQIM